MVTVGGIGLSFPGMLLMRDRGGEKINAGEVELLVAGHHAVAEIALVGMPDPRLGERGCACVVPRDPQNPPTLADICAYLEAEGLAKYKWPERLELIDALPRTQIGKVSKVTLRADIGAKLAQGKSSPAQPATLVQSVQSVRGGTDPVSPHPCLATKAV
jgi:acyl-CoA synthetase (AMP-forming)/AMP-acid ligase II